MANKVKFRFGSWTNYNALTTKDNDTLYFITDKKLVFKGSTLCGHVVSTETTGTGASEVVTFTYNNGSATDVTVTVPTSAALTAHADVTGNATVKGHVNLSDSTTDSSSDFNKGIAATPKAVNDALVAAKGYADDLVEDLAKALVFKGVIGDTAAGVTSTGLPTDGYEVGWTYLVNKNGNYAGYACEAGDIIIAVKAKGIGTSGQNSDWAVVQKNIDGAVTTTDTLTADTVVLGNGSKTVKKLANGSYGNILSVDDKNAVVWVSPQKTISSSSLDTQIPTAKAVYTALQSATQSAAPEWEELS